MKERKRGKREREKERKREKEKEGKREREKERKREGGKGTEREIEKEIASKQCGCVCIDLTPEVATSTSLFNNFIIVILDERPKRSDLSLLHWIYDNIVHLLVKNKTLYIFFTNIRTRIY